MSFEIKNHRDLTLVPIHILRDPKLSLAVKGAAAVMYSHGDLRCSETVPIKGQHQKHRTKSRIWRYKHFQNAQGYVKLYMRNALLPDKRKE